MYKPSHCKLPNLKKVEHTVIDKVTASKCIIQFVPVTIGRQVPVKEIPSKMGVPLKIRRFLKMKNKKRYVPMLK